MENLKCPSCGNETPASLSRCRHCGELLPNRQVPVYDVSADAEACPDDGLLIQQENAGIEESDSKERAGFVSFYLWLGVVFNAFMGFAYFVSIFTRRGLWSAYDPMYTRIFGFVYSAIVFWGFLCLKRWKKGGFYTLVLMTGVSFVMNLMQGGATSLAAYFPFLSLLILYAVLHIRKNGKSCWEQLS